MDIHLSALGCRLNEAELETWASEFRVQGHKIVPAAADADVLVLNTCAITAEAVRKSRKSIQRLQRQNGSAKLVVSGCYSTLTDPSELGELGIDLVVSNQDKDQLVSLTRDKLGPEQWAQGQMPEGATAPGTSALFDRARQRAFIKIQDGCRYRCSYCVVTLARGQERSRGEAEIINEVNRLHQHGIQEVVLTGVHVGGYGSDTGSDLFTLVSALLQETDIARIRFASVEPWDLPDAFFSLFENTRLMPHMHLPLQSGSDTVLKRMSRRCKTTEFRHLAETVRAAVPDFNITTDIIVGFPGESRYEWQESLDYIESIGFGHIHIFSFSPRQGTRAASMPEQIHPSLKKQRSQQLHQLAASSKLAAQQQLLDRKVPVLWESGRPLNSNLNSKQPANTTDIQGKNSASKMRYSGYTHNFMRVQTVIDSSVALDNALTTTLIKQVSDDNLQGVTLELISQPALADNATDKPAERSFAVTQASDRPGVIPIQPV